MNPLDGFDLVIFDCDGVVVDSEVLSCDCLTDAFHAHGVALELDEVVERFVGRSTATVEAYWRTVLHRDPPAAFFADHRRRVAAAFTDELKAMPQADEVLAKLPLPYCLASSSELGSHPAHPFGDAPRRLFRRPHLPCRRWSRTASRRPISSCSPPGR